MNPAADNMTLLLTARELIESLDDSQFLYATAEAGSVGCQFRHVLDFYDCFMAGREQGTIDYTARRRDQRLESERTRACDEITRITVALEALDGSETDRPVRVRLEGDYDRACDGICDSSVMRELQFLLSHTIHHFTIVRALLTDQGVELGDRYVHFGVAPSSVRYYERAAS